MQNCLPIFFLLGALAGCSLNPAPVPQPTLARTNWLAVNIDNTGVMDGRQSTLDFGADQSVTGNSGCNRFSGGVSVTGQDIEFGPLASTRMACPAAIMNQEGRFLRALSNAQSWSLDAERNRLTLLDAAGNPVLRLRRVPDPQ